MGEAKYLGLTANQLAKIASNLEVKNVKLCKFASDLLVGACDRCPFNSCDECDVRETARELGVEVRKP